MSLSLVACRTAQGPVGDRGCGLEVRSAPPLVLGDVSTASVSFDFSQLIGRRDQRRQCVDASIDGQAVQLEPFGNMSSEVCVFPKLIIHAGGVRHVLITHCNEAEAVGTHLPTGIQVRGHALAYRMLEVLDLVALSTWVRDLDYLDRGSGTAVGRRPAFFLEFIDELFKRTGATSGDDGITNHTQLDAEATTRVVLFQTLIDNRDWRILDITPIEASYFGIRNRLGTHNVFLVKTADGRVVPVAYDLELSGFVGIPPGIRVLSGGHDRTMLEHIAQPELLPKEPWLVRWMATRLLDFRRLFPGAEGERAVAHFRAHRADLDRTVDDPTLPEHTRALAREHVDAFFVALDRITSIPQTSGPVDLLASEDDKNVTCAAVPPGTPYEVVDKKQTGQVIRLLWKLRVDGDDATPMCPAAPIGFVPSGAL